MRLSREMKLPAALKLLDLKFDNRYRLLIGGHKGAGWALVFVRGTKRPSEHIDGSPS